MKKPGRQIIPAVMIACFLMPSYGVTIDPFVDLGPVAAMTNVPSAPGPADSQGVFSGWNITYTLPPGWQVAQRLGRTQILSSQTEAGVIFLGAGAYRNAQEAIADLSLAYQKMNLRATPVEQPQQTTISGLQAVVATYVSQDQSGRNVQGRFISVFTRHGTGLNMLAMTTPEQMPKLKATLERLAGTVQASPPAVNNQAVAALAGNWIFYSGSAGGGSRVTGGTSNSYEETLVLDGRGNFRWQSSASVSADASGYSGSAGQATSNADQGTYTVIGTSLVFRGTKGQLIVDFELQGNRLVVGGKAYGRS
ncbi:MAG: hypothetical protein ACXVI6_04370 [Candidatus Aminicenantales bacterium]